MADNTAHARTKIEGHRRAIREHAQKWHIYSAQHDKDFAWKTIQNAQRHIRTLKAEHPSLRNDRPEDSWRPGDAIP